MAIKLGGVPEHFNLPWHLAREGDAIADLDTTWEDQPGGTGEMLRKLEAGDLDMVSILTEGTVAAIDGGLPVTIVQVYVESSLQWGMHVPSASNFEAEADLEGARIAISRFTSGSHLMAFVLAERMGWEINEEQFVVVGGLDGAIASFEAGDSDLFLWDRFMTQPLVDAGTFRRVGVQPTPWPSFVIAVRDEVLTGQTTAVGRIVDAVVAEATALHGRPAIVDELTTRYELSAEAATGWLESTSFGARSAFDPAIHTTTAGALERAGFAG